MEPGSGQVTGAEGAPTRSGRDVLGSTERRIFPAVKGVSARCIHVTVERTGELLRAEWDGMPDRASLSSRALNM